MVGAHEGAYAFTVGQRRGVGLGNPAPDGARRYVVDVDIASRRVSVGPVAMLDVHRISAIRPRWCGPALEGSARPGCAGSGARRGDPGGGDGRRFGLRRGAGQPASGRGPGPGRCALRRHPGGGFGHDRAWGRVSVGPPAAAGDQGEVGDDADVPAAAGGHVTGSVRVPAEGNVPVEADGPVAADAPSGPRPGL